MLTVPVAGVHQGPYEAAGGEVAYEVIYDPQAENFDAEVSAAVAADSDAIVIIGFDETTKILTGLIEAGAGPADKNIYGTDGNMGNALAASFDDPSVVAGMRERCLASIQERSNRSPIVSSRLTQTWLTSLWCRSA